MALAFIILLILGPIAEIYVLLKSGAVFGVGPVIIACLGTAFLGAALLRIQGLSALRGAENDIRAGKVPVEAAVDGLFLAVAAPLLMTPGFITDAVGFSFLVPPFRHFIARQVLAALQRRINTGEITIIRRD